MNNPTDLQLQLALAKELPELIDFLPKGTQICCDHGSSSTYEDGFAWKDGFSDEPNWVTDREWLWVVAECEKKLTCNKFNYCRILEKIVAEGHGYQPDPNHLDDAVMFATWQQRAIAYFKTIGKEITQ